MAKEREQGGMDFGIRVGAVVEQNGYLLLVRHEKPGREPYWVLPGGRLEPGETIPECAARELDEETGLKAEFRGILYVGEFLRGGRHTVDVIVRAAAEPGAEPELGEDPEVGADEAPTLTEVRWVTLDDLSEIELLPPWVGAQLAEDAAAGWPGGEVYVGGVSA